VCVCVCVCVRDVLLGNDVRFCLYGDPFFSVRLLSGGGGIAVYSSLYVVFLEHVGYVSVVIIF